MPRKYRAAPKRVKVNKAKKLVTGEGPTLLERLSKQSNNIGTVAKAILPIALAINTEHKYFDVNTSGTAYNPGTNDSLVNLTGAIAQGTTDITRIGNSLLMKDIAIKIALSFASSATSIGTISRITLFVWKENFQDNPPTVAKIFEAPTAILSAFNKDYTDQMVILKDKVFGMQAVAIPGGSLSQGHRALKMYNKLDFHERFDGATTTDNTVNNVFILFRASPATSGIAMAYELYSRMNFTDN